MATRRLPPLRALEAFVRTVRLGSARAAADARGAAARRRREELRRRLREVEEVEATTIALLSVLLQHQFREAGGWQRVEAFSHCLDWQAREDAAHAEAAAVEAAVIATMAGGESPQTPSKKRHTLHPKTSVKAIL